MAPRERSSSVRTNEQRAVVAVLLVVVLWSLCSLFVRAGETNALVFTTWRLWLALPPLGLIVATQARRHGSAALWPRDVGRGRWLVSMFAAGALFAAAASTAFAAIRLTTLLNVTLIGLLQPLLVMGFAAAFLAERVPFANVVRSLVAIAGTVLVVAATSGGGTWSAVGDLVAVVALFLNSGWFLYGRVLRAKIAVDPFAFMFGTLTAAAIVLTPVTLVVQRSIEISRRGLIFAASVAIAGSLAHILMLWAHRYVPTAISAPLILGELPIIALGAWAWFGESLNAIQVAGSAIVVGALWGVFRSPVVERIEDEIPDPEPPV